MAKKEKVSFLFSYKYVEYFKDLTGEEVKQFLNDMVEYDKNGIEPNYDDRVLKTLWNLIKSDLKKNKDKYEDICQQNSIKQKKRWEEQRKLQKNTDVYTGIKKNTNDTDIDKDTHTDNEIDNKYVCINKEENSKEENSNFCHLERKFKIEQCETCLKNSKCPLKTDPCFILEKGCSFEEWLAKRQVLSKQLSEHDAQIIDTDVLDYDWMNADD